MPSYRERLVPGPGTAIAVLLLAPAILLILLPVAPAWGPPSAAVVTLGTEAALFLSAPVVAVRDGVLSAGRARIPVDLTADAEAFRGRAAVRARGVDLDARAWTLLRGWVDPVVQVPLTDPDDPVPYWVVSTRHPERLAATLADARAAAGQRAQDA